jgi:hypothetical protein
VKAVPKKKRIEPPDEQSKRFLEDAQRMIDAGELNPTEAEDGLDRMVKAGVAKRDSK